MNESLAWSPANIKKAKVRFGVKAYRPGQKELIETVMDGRDALGILPTGSGKSLCYQLPSLFLPRAVVVISPLISLMKDQQDKLEHRAVPVAKLDSTVSGQAERAALNDIRNRTPELIYVTPERFEQDECVAMLKRTGVSLIVVDEAHCVSQWGHDFRPAYLSIRRVVKALGRPPVLALTATATPDVASDIMRQLAIPDAKVLDLGIHRANLRYEVRRTVNDEEKVRELIQVLSRKRRGAGLIYVSTVREAVHLHAQLRQAGIAAGLYHGRLQAAERHHVQQEFMEGATPLIVATKAFGLGIDKQDLSLVVHYSVPDSIESYVQETGRAGRDGRTAHCVLLYRLEDRRVQSYFLGGKYPKREHAIVLYLALAAVSRQVPPGPTVTDLVKATALPKKKVQVVLAQLEAAGVIRRGRHVTLLRRFRHENELGRYLCDYEGRHQSDRDRLEAMMKYGQTTECRVRFLTRYFQHELSNDCGHCDNCLTGAARRVVDVRKAVESGLAAVV